MITLLFAFGAAAVEFPPTPTACRQTARATRRPNHDGFATLRSARHPVIVWYDSDHANSAEIAADVLATVETSWSVQVDLIGFRAPVLPDAADGPEFDVFLVDYQPFAAFVSNDDWSDDTVSDGYNGTSAFMVVDRNLPPAAVPSYLSHEFNHACQYATDFSEPSFPIWEAVATAAQDWTVGDAGYWDSEVDSFQEVPFAPVITGDSYALYYTIGLGYTYEYGAALWVKWLDEKLGADDGANGALLWEAAANEGFGLEPDAVDAFATVAGMTVGDALSEVAIARFLTGDDWDPRGLADAASWPPRNAVPASPLTGAALAGDHVLDPPPLVHGQAFVDVDLVTDPPPAPAADTERTFVFSASSATGLETALAVLWWDDAGLVGDLAITGTAPTLELPAEGLVRVVVALTNLGPVAWDGDDPAYVPGDQVLTVAIDDRAVGGTTPTTDPGATTDPGHHASGGRREEPGGCGCAEGGPASLPAAVGLVALGLRRRRR